MKPSNDKEAITLILEGMKAKGWSCLMVQDDTWSNDEADNPRVTTIPEAVEVITGVDEAFAYLYKEGNTDHSNPDGYIYFVLGNSPEEVACDYSVGLDPDLSSIIDPWWN